jgi:D-glycero-D-manno-heptose 1,7-bisphosphate phosphatase
MNSSGRERPSQAVILAGGRGTRLEALTATRPKPMIEIGGKPFLSYQIEQLREQGFRKVLLLLGYLPEVVRDYCGDGSRWGVEIEYSVSAVENETGRRLKLAEHLIDPYFLLLYCDNYWPMQFDKMWARFAAADVPAMLTVYTNKDGYTQNSIRVSADGYIEVYDKTRATPELQGVEISYGIFSRSLIEQLPDENVSFEGALYAQLAARRRLLAFVTDHRYYSVGSTARLPLTASFLQRVPTVILDRDGVLNKKPPKAQYVRSWSEFEWLPGAKQALQLLNERGYRVIVVSNQAGIGRGMMTAQDLEQIHDQMKREAGDAGGHIAAIYHCPHDWNDGCECRKPSPGLLFQAQRDFHLDLTRTPYLGDDERDAQAADRAGCPFISISESAPLLDRISECFAAQSDSRLPTEKTLCFRGE